MNLARRCVAVVVSTAIVTMVSSGLLWGAQGPKAAQPETKTKTRKAYDPVRRVPPYFAQLGLTGEQREAIYKIRGKHAPRIEALQKQIQEIQGQVMTECEAVLTSAQKQMLEEHRKAASDTRKAASAKTKAEP